MDKIFQIGIILTAYDKMSKVLQSATQQSVDAFNKLQNKIKETSEKLATVGTVSYFAGSQILNSMKKPIDAFMELEDASTQLKVTLMKDGGEISEKFEEIDRIAKRLGTDLPGTTSDFYKMASYLKALGVTEESIVGGALEASAKLGVVLKPLGVSYEEAAISVAKFKEALGIADKELIQFMDLIQRVAHQGVRLEEMRYAFADLAGTLQPLGLQGLDVAKSMTPLVAMLIKTGRSGKEVGNAISDMMRQAMDVERVAKANQMLSQFGIELSFIDEQTGKFKGPENLIAQLDKLKELPDVVRMQVFKALFGAGAAMDVANIIASKGIEGYNQMVESMARQAELNKRVALSLGTLRNVWEAFTGTLQNTLATIGEGAAPLLKWFASTLNWFADTMGEFASKNRTLTTILSSAIVVLGGAAMGFGALGIALSVVLRISGAAIKGLLIFSNVMKVVIAGIKAFSVAALSALRVLFVGMITNPFGWIILGVTALIAAGYLLYRNWDKISRALGAVWSWIKENWRKLLNIFLWVSPLTAPIIALNKLSTMLFGINLFEAGKRIITSLWEGIKSMVNKPVEAVKDMVQKIRNLLPFSPAKEGPFRDLHRIKIVETIAETIKPAPAVEAMMGAVKQILEPVRAMAQPLIQPVRQILEPVKAIAQPLVQPVRQILEPVRAMAQPLIQPVRQFPEPQKGTASKASVTVNYSPSINISGASPQAKEDFAQMLRQHQVELLRLIQDAQAKQARLAY